MWPRSSWCSGRIHAVPGGRDGNLPPDEPPGGTYGCWRGADNSAPVPLPWNEGAANGKAELAELSADASPLELGDWLAVCGPVLRDISRSVPGGGT